MDGPAIDVKPPAEYLRLEPTPDEKILIEQCDAHSGATVPWWRFSKVVTRVHALSLWVGQMDGTFRRARRFVIAGVSAAAVNLSALGVWYVHRVEAAATASERASELERRLLEYRDAVRQEIQDLRADLREVRADLRRLSGAEPPPAGGPDWPPPDKFSLLIPRKGPTCALAPVSLPPL